MKPTVDFVNIVEKARILKSINEPDEEIKMYFDRYTRMAQRLFSVPMTMISLGSEEKQWIASIQGIEVSDSIQQIEFHHKLHLSTNDITVKNDISSTQFFSPIFDNQTASIQFFASCPLKHKNGLLIGRICIFDFNNHHFDQQDQAALKDIAEVITDGIHQKTLSTTDDLTGLTNRRGFFELYPSLQSLAIKINAPLSLFFLDLNNFKKINDQYGHQEGDSALVATSKILLSVMRAMDIVARMGGDEFCILCLGVCDKQLKIIESRIRQAFDNYNRKSNKPYTIECSIGATSIALCHKTSLDEFLLKADHNMYEKKNSI